MRRDPCFGDGMIVSKVWRAVSAGDAQVNGDQVKRGRRTQRGTTAVDFVSCPILHGTAYGSQYTHTARGKEERKRNETARNACFERFRPF